MILAPIVHYNKVKNIWYNTCESEEWGIKVLLFIFKGGIKLEERVRSLIEKPLNDLNIKLVWTDYFNNNELYEIKKTSYSVE